VYNGKKEKLVLILLSDLYSKLEAISIGASRLSSYLNSHYLLTIIVMLELKTVDFVFILFPSHFELRVRVISITSHVTVTVMIT